MESAKLNTSTNLLERCTRKFLLDDCYGKASALSFYTLLSIVPILAVAFGIAKGFGFDHSLENQIMETFYQQKDLATKVITFAKSMLEQTQGSLIAGVGALMLFWTSFGLLGNLEKALNAIFGASGERPITRRIIDFLPLLIFLPFFFVASSSATFLIITKTVELTEKWGFYQSIKPFIYLLYYSLLISLSWLLLAFVYIYLPNRKPHYSSIIAASLIAGISFQAAQWGYIHLQVFLTSYNAIYGSFAAIPLFLLWLQVSWLLVLSGAEIASVLASPTQKEQTGQTVASQEELLLALCLLTSQKADAKSPLQGITSIGEELGISENQATLLVKLALENQLLVESNGTYFPARSISLVKPEEIRSLIYQKNAIAAKDTPALQEAIRSLQ